MPNDPKPLPSHIRVEARVNERITPNNAASPLASVASAATEAGLLLLLALAPLPLFPPTHDPRVSAIASADTATAAKTKLKAHSSRCECGGCLNTDCG